MMASKINVKRLKIRSTINYMAVGLVFVIVSMASTALVVYGLICLYKLIASHASSYLSLIILLICLIVFVVGRRQIFEADKRGEVGKWFIDNSPTWLSWTGWIMFFAAIIIGVMQVVHLAVLI